MKRKLHACICAILFFLLPMLAIAASPGFVCDNCDYEATSYAQRDVIVPKDGGTVKVREYYCPNCKTVFGSVEVPGSYQKSPSADNPPVSASNDSQESNPSENYTENTSIGTSTATGNSSEISPTHFDTTGPSADKSSGQSQTSDSMPASNPSENTGSGTTKTKPASSDTSIANVQPEQPATNSSTTNNGSINTKPASSDTSIANVQPEQPATNSSTTNNGSINTKPVSSDTSTANIQPEQPATNSSTTNNGSINTKPVSSGTSTGSVQPEQPATNSSTASTGTTNTKPASSGTSTVNVQPEQPATNNSTSSTGTANMKPANSGTFTVNAQPEQPSTGQNSQAVVYVQPNPEKEREPAQVVPEHPVQSVENYQSSSGFTAEEFPIVMVTEKPAASVEVSVTMPNSRSEITSPLVSDPTLPPVIGENPTFTPPPANDSTVTQMQPSDFRTDKYTIFSRYFPARRLHLKGDPEAQAPRAGIKIWPEEPGMSLLERMLNADP